MTRDRRRVSSNDAPRDPPDGTPTDADSRARPAEDGTKNGTSDDDTRRPGPAPVPERYAFDAEGDGVVVYDRERSDAWIKSDYALEVGPAPPDDPAGD